MTDPGRSGERLLALLEGAIHLSPEPVSLLHLAYALGEPRERITAALDALTAEYAQPRHGLMLRSVAGGYQFVTKPEHHEELRDVVQNLPPPAPLSKPATACPAFESSPRNGRHHRL